MLIEERLEAIFHLVFAVEGVCSSPGGGDVVGVFVLECVGGAGARVHC